MKLLFENWRQYLAEGEDPAAGKKQAKLKAFQDDKQNFLDSVKGALADSIDVEKLFTALAGATDPKTGKTMPMGKQAHSARVGALTAAASKDPDVLVSALMHDFVERGGDIQQLVDNGILTDAQKDLVDFLSSSDKEVAEYAGDNEPLDHMKHVFKDMSDEGIKDKLAMIKAADRVDNLNRRALDPSRKGPLTGKGSKKMKYLRKSIALFDELRKHASDPSIINPILNLLHTDAKRGFAAIGYLPDLFKSEE